MTELVPAKSDELDPDFKVDERIFHYTSSQGLYGILESNCLWGTHFQFLNDSKEFYAARESLLRFVEFEIRKQVAALIVNRQIQLNGIELKDLCAHEAETIINAMYMATLNIGWVFIFSGFSCGPDDPNFGNGGLLHWATYGRNGGYAIRLNPHKLKKLLEDEFKTFPGSAYRSCRVAYTDTNVPTELQDSYEIIGATARQMIEGIVRNRLEEVDLGKSAAPFLQICSVIKNSYFRDEHEARVVFTVMKDEEAPRHGVHVRHRGTTAIPFVKLFEQRLLGEHNPIEAIIVGPHPDRMRRWEALSTVLASKGLTDIEILESNVPYISE